MQHFSFINNLRIHSFFTLLSIWDSSFSSRSYTVSRPKLAFPSLSLSLLLSLPMAPGNTRYPPGYRFVPKDEEIVCYYLARQIAGLYIPSNPILEADIYKYSPDDLFRIHNLSENSEWYFFSSRTRKYPKGQRPDRAAGAGFWKATGAIIDIYENGIIVGHKTSLAYHTKTPETSEKTNWLMTEYQIKHDGPPTKSKEDMLFNKWVVCKIYRGKRSSKRKEKIDQNQHHQQELINGDQRNPMPPMPVTQVSENNPGMVDVNMRVLFNGMNSASSTSGSTEFYNTVQNVAYALEAHHYQQFPPSSFDHFAYGDQPTQLDTMNQFFQVMPLESDGEFPQSDPQSRHHGQINSFFDFNDTKDNGVYPYFQEAHSGFDGIFLSQLDPQSSHGGHLKPIQDSSDMRMFMPSTSGSFEINNTMQDIDNAQQLLPSRPYHAPFLDHFQGD